MKFANLCYKRSGRLTIGDDIQFLAIENLYNYMGINYNDVLRIEYHDLSTYDGEYVVLPISFPFYGYQHDVSITQFSPKIIPVFLGLSFMSTTLSNKEYMYLSQFAPIGCRDEYTMNNLRNNNVMAYLNGCMTAAFPKRRKSNENQYKKVFCIDVPESFRKYIPKEILKDCEFVSHLYYYSDMLESPEQTAKKVYEKYINEARLIITTRLHGALPNAAAGIPVILFKDQLSFRFTGIDKLIKVYTKDEYESIDWNPQPLDFEEEKKMILQSAANRVWDTYHKYKDIFEVSSFYERRDKKPYYVEFIDNTIDYIDHCWDKTEAKEYVLWGVTQTADAVYSYISKNYPKSKLVAVIDKTKRIEFHGVETCECDWLINNKDKFVFVCTGAAIKESYEFFEKHNIKSYYQCCEDGNKHRLEMQYRNTFENVSL